MTGAMVSYSLGPNWKINVLFSFKFSFFLVLRNYNFRTSPSTGQFILERWDKLMIYTGDGKLEIDNNLVEKFNSTGSSGEKKLFVCRFT
jgi:hypothetical protein